MIDTAECYPGSEEAIGRAVGHRRSEYILVSKCGHKVDGLEGDEWSGKLISATVDNSLRRLRTDHLIEYRRNRGRRTVAEVEPVEPAARSR